MISLVLAYAKPSVMYLAKREDRGYQLSADYGIPIKWGLHRDANTVMPPIPFDSVGLDYINADIYIRCAGAGMNIYRTVCEGDPHGRRFLHPPLAPILFSWVVFVPVEIAIGLWSICILLMAFFASWWCLHFIRRWLSVSDIGQGTLLCMSFLFTVSYPVIFTYERGNNSILIFFLFVVSAFCYIRRSWFWFGFVLTVAVLLKLFPLPVWCTASILGLWMLALSFGRKSLSHLRGAGFRLLAGQGAGLLFILGPLYREYHYFLFHHFPASTPHLAMHLNSINDHALRFAFGGWGLNLGIALWIVVTLCFIRSTMRWLSYGTDDLENRQRGLLALLYIAALSSYLMPRGASYDYHLVTNIPLICLLSLYPSGYRTGLVKLGLFFMMLGYALPRWMNEVVFGVPIHYLKGCFSFFLIFQTASLVLLAVYLLRPPSGRRGLISNG